MLLLHGQPGSARDWEPVVGGDRAGACDDRGRPAGLGRPESDPGGFELSADAALAALDERGIERAVIVGLSFGGAVAAWLGGEHPERVAALRARLARRPTRSRWQRIDRVLGAPWRAT